MASPNPKDWPSLKFFGVYAANDHKDLKTAEWAEFMKHNYHRELVKRRDFYLDTIETSTNSTFKSCKAAFNLLREHDEAAAGGDMDGVMRDRINKATEKDIANLNDLNLSAMMAIIINNDIHIAGCGNFIGLICSEKGQKI